MTARRAVSGRAGSHAAQHGQALVLGMLLAGAAVLVFVRYFGAGQVVAAKARQLHALDAAAYSGALTQARALNMLAYINRAHVGHQVAMAHLVTLGSWASLGGAQARQLASGNPPAYLLAMMFGSQHGAAYQAAQKAAGFDARAGSQGELARAYAAHDDVVQQVLGTVQDAVVAGLPQARLAAMQAVLARNYPGLPPGSAFDLVIEHDNWEAYVQRHSAQQLRPFIQGVAQLYGFLSPRDHTVYNPWVVQARCPHLRHQLRRRGGTELDATGRWQSTDTQSYHALRSNKWIGCYYREYAMGWGWIAGAAAPAMAGPHVDNPPDDFSDQDFWRWVKEATDWDIASGRDNPLANSRAVASRPRWQGSGLPGYFDTAAGAGGHALRLDVSLRHPGPQGLTVSTRSAAETFFDRPRARADGRAESANLFHPYWQARLAAQLEPGIAARGQP
ncbi:hypothetical protein [Pollutimonas bauzanensis]|uniref:Flp pilus-assembly TadE/G-like n=1 Tax=Pollutimonas bauzanensis TaxID=658167 RepID=A0A1M5M9J0_9BURK|nr:hypothetical protein [Pollutimonas bauzanensis]SHG73906.1 hypothetical protein SAMN04488135_101165 [Pollutimonas bauzanensis]